MKKSVGEMEMELLLKSEGYEFQQEYKFHPDRKWRFDFAFPDEKIAIEVEGGLFTQGRHTRGRGYIQDMQKYNAATILGWRVLRYGTGQINDQVMKDIFAIKMRDLNERYSHHKEAFDKILPE
jgi:very-short-patch-repair endonuclease